MSITTGMAHYDLCEAYSDSSIGMNLMNIALEKGAKFHDGLGENNIDFFFFSEEEEMVNHIEKYGSECYVYSYEGCNKVYIFNGTDTQLETILKHRMMKTKAELVKTLEEFRSLNIPIHIIYEDGRFCGMDLNSFSYDLKVRPNLNVEYKYNTFKRLSTGKNVEEFILSYGDINVR